MRTGIGDHLLALRRPAALAALAAGAGGLVGVLAPRMAMWRLDAQVRALDTVGEQPVTILTGAQTSPVAWLVAAVGALVIALAVLVAVDRPPAYAEQLLVGAGGLQLGAAGWLLVARPDRSAFTHHAGAAELVRGDVVLPTGVAIDLTVEPALGIWVLAAAGLLVVAGTMVALRRG